MMRYIYVRFGNGEAMKIVSLLFYITFRSIVAMGMHYLK